MSSLGSRWAAIGLVACLGGCGGHDFKDCEVSCTAESGCPNGLACSGEGYCRSASPTQTCRQILGDASVGASPDGAIVDADRSCTCSDPRTVACASGTQACDLGCVASAGTATCRRIVASNGVPLDAIPLVTADLTISGGTTFNTRTGMITGAITRDPGEGIRDGIAFVHLATPQPIGVFTFHRLTLGSNGTIWFVANADAAAFVSASSVTIDGTIDGRGGLNAIGGPGGGAGGSIASPTATGCGPGGNGPAALDRLQGGGGGGGRVAGARGGRYLNDASTMGGAGGVACLASTAEPLQGGSGGGGAGETSDSSIFDVYIAGGGGGGALQITAATEIEIAGTLNVSGGGGKGGIGGSTTRGAGAGGGAGGAILLEAPVIGVSGVLAANGGGGGGGAYNAAGGTGETGTATSTAAPGGAPGSGVGTAGAGGNGGAGTTAPGAGENANYGGGGGGGAVGVIYLRTLSPATLAGSVISPPAGTGALRTTP